MTEMTPLAAALAANRQVWGGWVVGPTTAGPQTFAQTGYDYVGFDIQHGYLSDADVAVLLRGLEHVGIGTVVRMASPASAPIGRVLDAGADGVIVPMVENARQAAEAVAATPGTHPVVCAASARCVPISVSTRLRCRRGCRCSRWSRPPPAPPPSTRSVQSTV